MIQEAANPASDPLRASAARVPEGAPDARVAAPESAPPTQTLNRRDDQFFEELTRTNNELANLQRDLARKHAELAAAQRKLQASEQRYLGLSACSPVGILEMDLAERCLYSNLQWQAITGLTAKETLGAGWQRVLDPHEAPAFQEAWTQSLTAGLDFGREVRFVTPSGAGRCAQFRSQSIRNERGAVAGHVCTVEDITPRKEAEAALEAAHHTVVDLSRQAGMAEVAAGVLHNVGNALNSVNVSANLLADLVRKFPVADLGRVVALLREQGANLGAFFADDPRGPKVADFLTQLTEGFTRQQQSQLQEMAALDKGIGHICEIVAQHQNYALVSGLTEDLSPAGLIDEALRLDAGSSLKPEFELVREFAPDLPRVRVDKRKVLQIMANLLGNARRACDGTGRADKRITVRTTRGNVGVRITVTDNGVGLSPENLTLSFGHGLTMRNSGPDESLHACANAAKAMGGSLLAHSDGLGQGASFTLELPAQAQPAPDPAVSEPAAHVNA